MDATSQQAGGYCMVYTVPTTQAATTGYFVTYYLTNANFLTSISTSTLSSTFTVKDPATSADTLIGFEYFQCIKSTPTSFIGTCSHFQMRPAASYTGGFRFEKGNLARALFFDPGNTG